MDKGRLEVTEEILDRVVYGMENQNERLFLDPGDGLLKEKGAERTPLIPMPPWGSSEGFRLMDRFTATLPDTSFRRSLTDILHSGGGVFRRFKDALKERPEMENLWRRYKLREMRKTALSWLSRWSEALALEALEELRDESGDWDDLTLADFSFREAGGGDRDFLAAMEEEARGESPGGPLRIFRGDEGAAASDSRFFVAEGPDGEPVGFSVLETDTESGEGLVRRAYVTPAFRGLGLKRHLVELALEAAGDGSAPLNLVTGDPDAEERARLEEQGFVPVAVWWRKTQE